jgi:hypothetical protein
MRIAFDLDNTLVPYANEFPVERQSFLKRILQVEPLRVGARELFQKLDQSGHEIWIYTTSFRTVLRIRITFWVNGIRLKGIVNQKIHSSIMKGRSESYSKYPPAFDIDLLVDDAEGVKLEGEKGGFNVIWVKPNDINWVEKVLKEISIL